MIHLANFSLTEKMKKIILKEQCKVLCCFLTFLFFYFNAFQFPPSLFYTVSSKNFEKCRGLLLHLFSCRMNMCSMSLSSLNLMLQIYQISKEKGAGGRKELIFVTKFRLLLNHMIIMRRNMHSTRTTILLHD